MGNPAISGKLVAFLESMSGGWKGWRRATRLLPVPLVVPAAEKTSSQTTWGDSHHTAL